MSDDDNSTEAGPFKADVVRPARESIYEVGYGKPPKRTRFAKGQSGNPAGRPRNSSPNLRLSDQPLLQAALSSSLGKVKIREGNKVREVTYGEAMIEAIKTQGLKGNARSAGMWLDITQTAHLLQARERKEEIAIWTAYREDAIATIQAARVVGETPPDLLPHPDDIEINPVNGVTFTGPFEETGRDRMLECIALRDVLIMQDVLDHRTEMRLDETPVTEPGGALVVALLIERAIPPRLRLSSHELVLRQWCYWGVTKRQLLKDLHYAWKRLGHPRPRGFVFPERSRVVESVRFVFSFAAAAMGNEIDVDAISRGEFDDNFLAFLEKNGRNSADYLDG